MNRLFLHATDSYEHIDAFSYLLDARDELQYQSHTSFSPYFMFSNFPNFWKCSSVSSEIADALSNSDGPVGSSSEGYDKTINM